MLAVALSLVPVWLAPVPVDRPGERDAQRLPTLVTDRDLASDRGVGCETDAPIAIEPAPTEIEHATVVPAARLEAARAIAPTLLAVLVLAPKTSPPRHG